MSDLALLWPEGTWGADLAMAGADLALDDGLKTAVIISLFTDRRAAADDPLPAPSADRRGWWADIAPAIDGDLIGSRLWLLAREKQLQPVLGRARDYARESLEWMIEDGVAAAVEVTAEFLRPGVLAIGVAITRPGVAQRQHFDFVWKAV